ncbi:hypothetical protein K474DRAFT_431315 [Panus rudis PR-1116 ss-1]|nr:hypothetical protein K474DRAFT_431315 [Panus rudis PR-1116 ss-1]
MCFSKRGLTYFASHFRSTSLLGVIIAPVMSRTRTAEYVVVAGKSAEPTDNTDKAAVARAIQGANLLSCASALDWKVRIPDPNSFVQLLACYLIRCIFSAIPSSCRPTCAILGWLTMTMHPLVVSNSLSSRDPSGSWLPGCN